MNKISALLVILSSLVFISCQKEVSGELLPPGNNNGGGGANSMVGTWKFISMTATSKSTQIVNDGISIEKAITYSNYTTINNTGTVVIDATTMTTNNMGYAIDTIAKAYLYSNNVLIDSLEFPFQVTAPVSSGTTNYTRVNADSIYFSAGSMMIGGTTQQSVPGGARIRFEGNKLIMTGTLFETSTQNMQGIVTTSISEGTMITTLERQ